MHQLRIAIFELRGAKALQLETVERGSSSQLGDPEFSWAGRNLNGKR